MNKKIKIGSQFSGVGAFEQSLVRLGVNFKNIYAADWDRYARQTYLLNFEEPEYYVKDVHDTPIKELTDKHGSLDIAMFSPPCQAFSMAGKRLGKDDKRGVLFFNSLEFIKENKPRYFIFENVKGLLSHDKVDKNAVYGRTFQEWSNYLGGKSVNGVHTFFPYEDSVPYHIYFQVLNAKHYGIPQNRERIFIIGIRDDEDNNFQFPKPIPLEKRLKDVLESEVDEKYFLSDNMIDNLITYNKRQVENNTGFSAQFRDIETTKVMSALKVGGGGKDDLVKVGFINQDTQASQVFSENGTSPSICAGTHGYALGYVETENKLIAEVKIADYRADEGLRIREDGNSPCITSSIRHTDEFKPKAGTRNPPLVIFTNEPKIGAIRGRNPNNPKSRESGLETEQMLEINENGTSNALTTVQKDNVVVISTNNSKGFDEAEEEEDSINFSVPSSTTRRGRVGKKVSQTLDTQCNQGIATKQLSKQQLEKLQNLEVDENIAGCITEAIGRAGSSDEYISSVKRNAMITQRIRRLTPRECFNLMDFNQEMIDKTIESKLISDSQLYKQAGNSICVGVLAAIIKNLKL